MKQQNISYKNFLINYLIFFLSLAVISFILIYTIKVTQKSWNKNLQPSIQSVLEEKDPDTWIFEGASQIDNPLTTAAACYNIRNKKNGEYYKAVIIRIQTFYGPFLGVFIMDKNKNVEFKGFALLHGRVSRLLSENPNSRRINYWMSRIPEIIK